mmetsp:Transcript_31224/g.57073  ORF Transcript_31224/g.57073 Transcript_31224/m.57073 type:complete len:218 (-) Transcript_31224:97-750(-)
MSSIERERLCSVEDGRDDPAPPPKAPVRMGVTLLFAALAGVAIGRLSAPPHATAAVPTAQPADSVSLAAQAPLPSGVEDGLKAYEELFTSWDPAMVSKVFHPKFSITNADPPDSLTFTVGYYKDMEELFDMIAAVRSGKKSEDTVPEELKPFVKPFKLYNAYPPMRQYALGENIHVTEINDKANLGDGTTVAFISNLHWVKTSEGWRMIDKVYTVAQ